MDILRSIAKYFSPPPAQEPTIVEIIIRLCHRIWYYFRPPPPPVVRFLGDDKVINVVNVGSLILVFVCPVIMGVCLIDLIRVGRQLHHWNATLKRIADMEEDEQGELSREEEVGALEDGASEVAKLEDEPNELALVPIPAPSDN